jgi:hypothetical protein
MIMTLSPEVVRHHTAWVQAADSRPFPVRYAVDRDHMVWFGDQLPDDATNGSRVTVTVHEIAGGPALAQLHGIVHDITADDVDRNTVLDLLEHVSLGRTAGEVDHSIATHLRRRLVTLDT